MLLKRKKKDLTWFTIANDPMNHVNVLYSTPGNVVSFLLDLTKLTPVPHTT